MPAMLDHPELKSLDDRKLLDRWRDGDMSAGDALFQRHYDSLYNFFANKVEDEIQDLVQNTFTACVNNRDSFRGQSSVRTYLFAIARNQLRGYLRRLVKDHERLDYSVTSLMDLGITPRTRLDRDQEHGLLRCALRSLPLEQQELLELKYWEDMSSPELSQVLGISEDAVHARLSRARKSLAKHVEKLRKDAPQHYEPISDLDSWARSLRDSDSADNAGSDLE